MARVFSLQGLVRRDKDQLVKSSATHAPDVERFDNRTIVIGSHAGGLGDNLAYSALPRLYKGAGARRVLVSRKTNYGESFARNPEIADYVWTLNPFVDGVTDEPANVGETGWPPAAFFRAAKQTASPIDTVAHVHRLAVFAEDGKTRLLPPTPDLFYRHKKRPDFTDTVVCDPHSISQNFSPASFNAFAGFVAEWYDIDLSRIVVLCNAHSGTADLQTLPGNARYTVKDIYEYTDIIGSSRAFLVTESGGQSVAAAVRQTGTFVLTTTRAFNERHFVWPTNRYCVTGQMTPGSAEWPTLRNEDRPDPTD